MHTASLEHRSVNQEHVCLTDSPLGKGAQAGLCVGCPAEIACIQERLSVCPDFDGRDIADGVIHPVRMYRDVLDGERPVQWEKLKFGLDERDQAEAA
jgi:hypothetical protein